MASSDEPRLLFSLCFTVMFRFAEELEIEEVEPQLFIATMRHDVVGMQTRAVLAAMCLIVHKSPIRLTLAVRGHWCAW